MRTARFCSECGEALKPNRGGFAPLRAHCDRCAPRFRVWRLLQAINLVLLVTLAFVAGRTLTPQRTVYRIGTGLEPLAASQPASRSAAASTPAPDGISAGKLADETTAICGAPTKSGKPCRRKVKGGGYCFQHRDKMGQKNASPSSQ